MRAEWLDSDGLKPSFPLVSVIVPALNARDTIERCVASLARQDWPALEILVVDNGSSDATASLAARAGARVVVEGQRGRSRARNRGAAEARGTVLAFMDADCQAPPDWVRASVAALRQPWLVAVQARVQKSSSAPPGRSFVQGHYYWPFLDTCALVTTRSAFETAGGFDEQLPRNEDMDFSFRLLASGFAFAWLPDTIVRKEHELNARDAARRGWVGGTSLATFFDKWRAHLRVSRTRFWTDLSKRVVKAAVADARRIRDFRATSTFEALGCVLGCVYAGLRLGRAETTERTPRTQLAEALGQGRFPVFGPDETLLFDAANQRILRLNRERSDELRAFIDGKPSDPDQVAGFVREFGFAPRATQPSRGE